MVAASRRAYTVKVPRIELAASPVDTVGGYVLFAPVCVSSTQRSRVAETISIRLPSLACYTVDVREGRVPPSFRAGRLDRGSRLSLGGGSCHEVDGGTVYTISVLPCPPTSRSAE